MAIRWRQSDITKLRNYVRKFNTAITKMEKQYPELADTDMLPLRKNMRQLTQTIHSRNDFNRELKRIDRFFRKGQRTVVTDPISGFKGLKWTFDEARYSLQSINYRRRRMREKIGIMDTPYMDETLRNISLSEKYNELQSRMKKIGKYKNNFDTVASVNNSWRGFVQQLTVQASDSYLERKNKQFYENYITTLYQNFSNEQADEIVSLIESMDLTGYELYSMTIYDEDLTIEFLYGPEESEDKFELIKDLIPYTYNKMVENGTFSR